jgi:hypothetical protein
MPASQPLPSARIKVIACATVIEEMLPLMPESYAYEVLDFGLHRAAKNLRATLQDRIDQSCAAYDTLLLGYGLCSLAVVGLQARTCTLVIPRVDDCIAIFLGSGENYQYQSQKEMGTYYLTKGWIEAGDSLFEEKQRLVEKYGEEKADFIMGAMLKNYTRLAYIDTGMADQEKYLGRATHEAVQLGLRFEVIPGSNRLVQKMLFGPWDAEFVVAPPGHVVEYLDFKEA